jgi:hypothetical protein
LAARTKCVIDSTDFSGDFNQAALNFSQSEIDVTTFGVTGWAKKITGISSAALDFTGFGQQSGHTLDAKLFTMLGAPATATSWEIDVPTSNPGDVRYTGLAFLKSAKTVMKPVDAYRLDASLSITGAVIRATIAS